MNEANYKSNLKGARSGENELISRESVKKAQALDPAPIA